MLLPFVFALALLAVEGPNVTLVPRQQQTTSAQSSRAYVGVLAPTSVGANADRQYSGAIEPSGHAVAADRAYVGVLEPTGEQTLADSSSTTLSPTRSRARVRGDEVGLGAVAGEVTPRSSKKEQRRQRRLAKQKVFRKHRFLPFPTFRTEPSVGPTFGLRGRYVYRRPNTNYNVVQADIALRLSTKLVQQHELLLRIRNLLHRQEIINVGFEYTDDPVFPYVGEHRDVLFESDKVLEEKRFQADRITFGPDFNYQEPILELEQGKWYGRAPAYLRWFAGYRIEFDRIQAYADSVLEREAPEAIGWTRRAGPYGGLAWDSRNNEWSPSWGGLHDVSFEAATPWLGATETWVRLNASFRWYRPLGTPKVVFAWQLLIDGIIGKPPIVAIGEFGGLFVTDGFGGRELGRGFYRRRFIGPAKGMGGAELRYEPWEFRLRRWTVAPGIKLFADVGKVFRNDHLIHEDLHLTGGAGLYLVWDRFMVIRADLGASREGVHVYATTGHAF